MEGLVEGLVIFDLDGNVLHLNTSARRFYGFRRAEHLGTLAAHPEFSEHWYADGGNVPADATPAARVLRGETFSGYELWAQRRSSPQRWLGAYSGTQIEDSVTFGVLTVRDVTQERELEARYRATFAINPTAISIVRLSDLRFNDVNESFLRLTGYARDEVVGKTAAELGIYLEEQKRNQALRQLRRDQADQIIEHESSLRTKTGAQRQVLSEGRVIFFDSEPYLIDTYLDITERKRSEGELMRAIQATMADPSWFTRVVLEKLAEIRSGSEAKPGLEQLTKREQGVLELLARGYGNEQIAQELHLSRHTVRNYVATLYSKLEVKSRAEAVIWARERGLVFSV